QASQSVYNLVGTAGSTTFAPIEILNGKTKMDEALAPMGDRKLLLNSRSGAAAVDARKGLFQSATAIGEQYKKGMIGTADGFDWMSNELLYTHTNGNDVTGATLNATATEATASMALAGITANTGTVTKGTVFTVAGVNKVHPITKQATGVPQQFVVTALATANGSGVAAVTVSPAMYTATSTGQQNIDALPQ
ncbi:unnamed protein product, partial [Phaeothamnion confervicola]